MVDRVSTASPVNEYRVSTGLQFFYQCHGRRLRARGLGLGVRVFFSPPRDQSPQASPGRGGVLESIVAMGLSHADLYIVAILYGSPF